MTLPYIVDPMPCVIIAKAKAPEADTEPYEGWRRTGSGPLS